MANGWTQERKDRQRLLIQGCKPWTQSTGPKSPEGLGKASQNSFKHGARSASIFELRRELHAFAGYLCGPWWLGEATSPLYTDSFGK